MKRKLVVGLLVVTVGLGVLVVKGVSQQIVPSSPPPLSTQPTVSFPPLAPISVGAGFSKLDQRPTSPQQEGTFEQLADALKAVRARQKELKAQETDLLTKMAEKVEDKRKDLQQSEEVLKQLRNDPNRLTPVAMPSMP